MHVCGVRCMCTKRPDVAVGDTTSSAVPSHPGNPKDYPSAPDLSLRVGASHLGPVDHSHPEVALLGTGSIGIDHLCVPRCQSRGHAC